MKDGEMAKIKLTGEEIMIISKDYGGINRATILVRRKDMSTILLCPFEIEEPPRSESESL